MYTQSEAGAVTVYISGYVEFTLEYRCTMYTQSEAGAVTVRGA